MRDAATAGTTAGRWRLTVASAIAAVALVSACAPSSPGTPTPPPDQVPGNPDVTFNPSASSGVYEFGAGQPNAVIDGHEDANSDVFLVGAAGNPGQESWWWKRTGADGHPDGWTHYLSDPSGIGKARALTTLPDGSRLIAGYLGNDAVIIKTTPDGDLDGSFGTAGRVTLDLSPGFDDATGLAVTPDGHVVVGLMLDDRWTSAWTTNTIPWSFTSLTGPLPHLGVARLTATGQLDPDFATGGVFELPAPSLSEAPFLSMKGQNLTSVVVLGDSSVVASGAASRDLDLVGLTPTGTLDPAFGTGGVTRLLADTVYTPIPPGVGGLPSQIFSAELAARDGGGFLTAFSTQGYNGQEGATVAWNATGQLDTGFGGGDGILSNVAGRHMQMLPGGGFTEVASGASVARFTAAGTLDATFGTAGSLPLNVVQPPSTGLYATTFRAGWHHVRSDGKITVAGEKVYVSRDLIGITTWTYNVAIARILTS